MSSKSKKILLAGLFLSEKNKHKILRTAADQLNELLQKNNYETITTSPIVNPIARLLDTLFTVISCFFQYHVAIVPLYGTPKSFLASDVTIMLLKLLRKKIVVILHGGSIPERMKKDPTKFLRVMKRADVVVSPSPFLLSVVKSYGISSVLIENVITQDDYSFNKKKSFSPRLFWMRTFEDIYNPQMAVRVAALLAKKYPEFKMVMAGHDRGALQATKKLIEELGLQQQIELPGYITNEQKNRYAKECDFYICTNRVDNAPVSVIEMMNLGLPVVSVNIGGLPYFIDNGKTGLLVDLDDDKAMAATIINLIENPASAQQLVANGKAYASQFGEQPVMSKWERLFVKLSHETTSVAITLPKFKQAVSSN